MSSTLVHSALYPMTVVIPTLGGPCLRQTVDAINRGSVVPAEILICMPFVEATRVAGLPHSNVRVIATDCQGQVAQRAIGFRHSSHDFVMQLDDDALLSSDCIRYLLETLSAYGGKAAVAPALRHIVTGESVYRKPRKNRFLLTLYYWAMNGTAGYQPGRIDKSCTPVGIDPDGDAGVVYEVEWVAGGCLLHRKENLVLEDFYPFAGKAYCEDIIHSHLLRTNGVRLFVDARARCHLEPRPSSVHFGFTQFVADLAGDFRARKYFMRLSSRRSVRIYLFYAASCLSYALKRILRLRRSCAAA